MHTISMSEKIQSQARYKDPILTDNNLVNNPKRPQKILLNIVSIETVTIMFEKIQ